MDYKKKSYSGTHQIIELPLPTQSHPIPPSWSLFVVTLHLIWKPSVRACTGTRFHICHAIIDFLYITFEQIFVIPVDETNIMYFVLCSYMYDISVHGFSLYSNKERCSKWPCPNVVYIDRATLSLKMSILLC